ncbi:MAG TPA: winged helix-turn-helix domain-containing protein [Candidatus Limnocylindria bacterium]|nr:winged helix-turn-helix domain-containing protein [Candidatus Limnocylindria bacterium]
MPTSLGVPRLVALSRSRRLPDRRVAALRVGDLRIDALRRRIQQGSRDVRLSPVEHILLYTLAAVAGVLVSYRELADALGDGDQEVRHNTLARHVSSLRRKLRDDAERPRYIETIPNLGYRFVAVPKTAVPKT